MQVFQFLYKRKAKNAITLKVLLQFNTLTTTISMFENTQLKFF